VLPSDYSRILADGVQALRDVEIELRARAERQTDAPDLWLAVRDVSTLAGRLRESDDWAWQTGFADIELSPADLRVLTALLEPGASDSPYRDAAAAPPLDRHTAIRSLHDFLARYMAGDFELEDTETCRPTDDAPAS
jgi:hypothetical protein